MWISFSPEIALGDLATAVSVFVIGILGIATLRQSERQKRRENTINVLLEYFDKGQTDEFSNLLHGPEPSPDGKEMHLTIRTKLNQFEFLCVTMRNKILDEELILQDTSFRIYQVYKKFKPYIEGRRKATGVKELYQNVEWAVTAKICPRWGWQDPTKEQPPNGPI